MSISVASSNKSLNSLAIAGAWGYIGRKFLEAGWHLDLRPFVFDFGPQPADISTHQIQNCADEEKFYRLPADIFHLALPPDARQLALKILLERGQKEAISILNEKPMASPEHPEHCHQLLDAIKGSRALMLFDFLELFSPITQAIVDYLSQFKHISVHSIEMRRMKDREDPSNLRNRKVMVSIQFQESIHCLAWVLYLFSRLHGSLEQSLNKGLCIQATSKPYDAPNPEDYRYVVDGQCIWQLKWGKTRIDGRTDFKRNAPWTKRRCLRGEADGKPFEIEAEFQEGRKQLVINGVDQQVDPHANGYVDVLETFVRWRSNVGPEELMRGIYPNPMFAFTTYQLSAALWRASYDQQLLEFDSWRTLLQYDAKYANEVPRFSRYR